MTLSTRSAIQVFLLTLVMGVAFASSVHPLGWSEGTNAASTATAVTLDLETAPVLALPKKIAKKIKKRTLLVYFAPDCSHCKAVAPAIAELIEEFDGDLRLLGIATARTGADEIQPFVEEYGWDGAQMVIDSEAEISAALGAKSTPVAVLVDKRGKEVVEIDRWMPLKPGDETLVRMQVRGDPWSVLAEGGYLGNNVCATCHSEEFRSWELSHHSVAWRTLVLSGSSRDPKCTACHVTGTKEDGGWQGVGDRRLVNVGCESCHSASGPHDGEDNVARETCETCHDKDHSINFSFEKGAPHIDHFTATKLDDDAFKKARKALVGGEAPKPLLAFGDGPYVGAAACAECHEDSHAWWGESGHGAAMDTLIESKDHEKVDCVRCHATPTVSGATPTELGQYRVEESVGCESCHGPGGEHVEAGGGVDTIVGLGGSCPVCVIEAICTSCHTPKWDKDWDLDTDLARIAHIPPETPPEEGQ